MLSWNPKITHVSKSVLSFTRREQRVEDSVLWVFGFLLYLLLLLLLYRRLVIRNWIGLSWPAKLRCCLLFV